MLTKEACAALWLKLRRKAFRRTPIAAMVEQATTRTNVKRVLTLLDLLLFGLGATIGSGVFVLTGEVARNTAGPAVILSYAIAGFASLFPALCYAEFASEIPVSGAAYNYITVVFGEMPAWMAAAFSLFEVFVSTSTIAKGITGYLCTLIGIDSSALVMSFAGTDSFELDIVGCVVILLLAVLLAIGVRESFTFNGIVTVMSIIIIFFTIAASAPNIETDNYSPFLPKEFGKNGPFRAAATIFFAFLGFEAMGMVAEESRNPTRDIPLSIILTLMICLALYGLMAAALVGMIPYKEIDVLAPFATAFKDIGWDWASRIVSVGALVGILTSVFGSLCAQCRLTMVLARDGFLPQFLATIHPTTATPVISTMINGILSAMLALFLTIDTLSELVSVGVLLLFLIVCSAAIWRRYCKIDGTGVRDDVQPANSITIGIRIGLLILFSAIEGIAFENDWPGYIWLTSVACFLGVMLSFQALQTVYNAKTFGLSLQPVVGCLGIFTTMHLMLSFGTMAYIRLVCCLAITFVVYVFYGVHHTSSQVEQTHNSLLL